MASLKQRLAAYEGASSSSSSLPSSSSSLKMQQEQSDASLADRNSARERSVGSRNKKGASSAPSLKERMSAYQGAAAQREQEVHQQSQEFSLPPLPDHSTSSSSSTIKEPKLQDRTIMASFRPSKENSVQNRMSKKESSSDPIIETKENKFIPKKKKLSSLEERMAKYVEVSSFPVALEMKINCPSETVKAIESGSNTPRRHTSNNAKATPPKSKEQQTGAVLQERMATYEEVISPRSQSNECAVVATKKKQRATVKPKRFKAKKAGGSDLRDRMAKYLQSSPDVPAEAIDEQRISPEEQRVEGDGKARMMSKHQVIRTTLGVPEMMDSVDSEHPTTEDDDNDPRSVSFVEAPGASSTMQPAENKKSSAPRKVGDGDSQPEKPGKTDPQCMKAGGDNSLGTEYYESSKSKEVPSDAGNEHPAVLKRSFTPKKLGGSDLQRRMAAFEEASSPKVFRKKEISVAEEEEHNSPKSEEAVSNANNEWPAVLKRSLTVKKAGGGDLQKRMLAFEEALSPEVFRKKEISVAEEEEHNSSKIEEVASSASDERPGAQCRT